MKKFLKKIFAPDMKPESISDRSDMDSQLNHGEVSVREIQHALLDHFMRTKERLSDDYTLLYHTSFTLYLKAINYEEISDTFPSLAGGAEKMLTGKIKEWIKRSYPGYTPHSKYWQFQLVEIPADADLDGMDSSELDSTALVQIHSTVYPPAEGDDTPSGSRIVTTVQGTNSLRAIRNCINPELLKKLYLVEKDRVKLTFDLYGTPKSAVQTPASTSTAFTRAPKQSSISEPTHSATLEAQDGEFIDHETNRLIHTVAMTGLELHITGRNGANAGPDVQIVRTNSDRVLNPHAKIRRNPSSGKFEIMAFGPMTVGQIALSPNSNQWRTLSKKSTIILDDEIQIKFQEV